MFNPLSAMLGGYVGYSRAKTRYIATESIGKLLLNGPPNRGRYYWTLTIANNVQEKDIAETMLKPVKDLILRKSGSFAGVWEQQERGSWHVHFITDVYLDVNIMRPWLVERGWGPQMRVVRCQLNGRPDGDKWVVDMSSVQRLIRYLGKYVTKSLIDANGQKHARVFFCSSDVRAGSVRFSWVPEVNPSSYLYYWGKGLFFTLFGRLPTFRECELVIRLGVEDTDWLQVDPWWMPRGSPPPPP